MSIYKNVDEANAGNFFSDKFIIYSLTICILLLSVQVLLILSSYKNLPLQIPIFYSNPWGEDILGKTIFIWIIPFVSLLVNILNFTLAKTFFSDKFLSKILIIFAILIGIFTFYDTFKIISLVS